MKSVKHKTLLSMLAQVLMIVGFVWLLTGLVGLSSYQHMLWIEKSQNLPEGDLIPREAATSAMRELALAVLERVQSLILPVLILTGGSVLCVFTHLCPRRLDKGEPDLKEVTST